jgi:hypothetical protein
MNKFIELTSKTKGAEFVPNELYCAGKLEFIPAQYRNFGEVEKPHRLSDIND